MKQHLLAFGGAAQDYSAGNVTVPVIADSLIRIVSNVLQLTDDWKAIWSWFGGVGLSKVRVNSAGNRAMGYPNLMPIQIAAVAGDNPPINDMRDYPLIFNAGENVSIQATNAAAQATVGVLAICSDTPNYNINGVGLRKVRFTASVTSLAYGWSSAGNIVLDDDLEYGVYGIFGMQVYEGDAIAARLLLKNQVERPGVICGQAATDRPPAINYGGLGLMGTFETLTPPFIESLHIAAAAQTLTGFLYIAKIR